MQIFLSGPMGAGKSTLTRALGARLGLPARDLDAEIERAAQLSIPELFATRGESGFRAIEREVLAAQLEEASLVLALGGGTVVDATLRRDLLRRGVLVTLRASEAELLRRLGGGEGRPLLQPDPAARLKALLGERADAYAECHGEVHTDRGDPLTELEALVARRSVVVPLGRRTYRVELGRGILPRVETHLEAFSGAVLVADRHTAFLRDTLRVDAARVTLEPGDHHKSVESVAAIWDAALDARVDRDGVVVAVGGGMVGDLAGFAAATLLRGVAFGQAPTSLLAMVDASIGGKTGLNRPAGKNLVGAFHQPRFVVCDIDTLRTLPIPERISGLAEVVKSAWISGEDDVAALERDARALRDGDPDATLAAITRSARLKATIVAADEHEAHTRVLLNLGHTIGHALEAASDYRLRHGEAVALGLVAAARVGKLDDRLERLLALLGLPTDLDAHLGSDVLRFVAADKKRHEAHVRFVVPGAPGTMQVRPMSVDDIGRAIRAR